MQLEKNPACLLMVPAKETVKVVEKGVVKQTLKREQLWMAQTPQAFDTRLIISCYKKAADLGIEATDDAAGGGRDMRHAGDVCERQL